MKYVLVAVMLIMVVINLYCFAKSRKYSKLVKGNDEESDKNFKLGMKYIKISIVLSFLICITGAAAVLIVKLT